LDHTPCDSTRAKTVLGIDFIPIKKSIIDMAQAMWDLGLIKPE